MTMATMLALIFVAWKIKYNALLFPHKERGMCAYVDVHIYRGLQIFRITVQFRAMLK